MKRILKGRGTSMNTPDPFARLRRYDLGLSSAEIAEEGPDRTHITEVDPKSIVNEVKSPDVGMKFSINPYQGCEHGCAYCYARNTHPYWGLSAGLDFESKIMVKKGAPALLRRFLSNPRWEAEPIVLSGNTDCYQPIEKKFGLTRSLLQVFLEFGHPVGIITKNALIQRDIDILIELAKNQLIQVVMSVTTLDETLRQRMEPRTASVKRRLETIAVLAKEGIPVSVNVAPVIPGINEHEIFEIIRVCALMGASHAGYTMVRLNGDVETIFGNWLEQHYPDRKDKVMNKIAHCHGGKVNDSRFGKRMRGEGEIANVIRSQFKLAVTKFLGDNSKPQLNVDLFNQRQNPQMLLEF